MGQMTISAILDFFCSAELEIATAVFAQKIKRAIAEKTIKIIAIRYRMAREILAFMIAEKPVTILHYYT
jgi:hypothetical protein